MPISRQAKLDQLMRDGMTVYPSGVSAIPSRPSRRWSGARPATIFKRVPSGKVWGGVNGMNGHHDAGDMLAALQLGTGAQESATRKLYKWLQKANPRLYAAAMRKIQREDGLGAYSVLGLGQTQPTSTHVHQLGQDDTAKVPWYQKAIDAVTSLAPQYVAYKQQKEVMQIQVARAEQGLPPLDTGQYASAVQVGVDPATIRAGAREAVTALTQSPIVWVAGGLLAFMAFGGMKKGARRRR